jgi:hypothetical protein
VSEDLAQLALLYIMSGEVERALPLLHRRLVIHEKFGPGASTLSLYMAATAAVGCADARLGQRSWRGRRCRSSGRSTDCTAHPRWRAST